MDANSKKYKKFLKPFEYVVITSGYILLVIGMWLIIYTTYQYVTSPTLAQTVKAPPVFPLFPYFTEFFNLNSFFPPFYFTYFILVIAIIAVSHEFSHGLFMRLNKVKILSSGFAFLGPFIGAFVEQDEKQMNKATKRAQLSILAAGTFANVIMAIIFGLIFWAFFALAFIPGGIYFNTYAMSAINTTQITSMENVTLNNASWIQINSGNSSYFTTQEIISYAQANQFAYIPAYDNSPAFRNQLAGAIVSIDKQKITSYDNLRTELAAHSPGDNIAITTIDSKGTKKTYNFALGNNNGKAFLGIGISLPSKKGFSGAINSLINLVRDPSVYYISPLGDFGMFIYNFLWWVVLINFLVAVMNMLPLGILDGGRFFFITIWGITGKKKAGEWAYKIATWFLLGLIIILMIKWALVFF